MWIDEIVNQAQTPPEKRIYQSLKLIAPIIDSIIGNMWVGRGWSVGKNV